MKKYLETLLIISLCWNFLTSIVLAGFIKAYMEHEYTLQSIEQTWSAS